MVDCALSVQNPKVAQSLKKIARLYGHMVKLYSKAGLHHHTGPLISVQRKMILQLKLDRVDPSHEQQRISLHFVSADSADIIIHQTPPIPKE